MNMHPSRQAYVEEEEEAVSTISLPFMAANHLQKLMKLSRMATQEA